MSSNNSNGLTRSPSTKEDGLAQLSKYTQKKEWLNLVFFSRSISRKCQANKKCSR
jgi:hypothetical protein